MTPAHLHLALNHFPIITSVIAFLVFLSGLLLKNKSVKICGLSLTLLAGLFTLPAFLTGEGAEEQIEAINGVSHTLIHEHEEMAELLIWLVSINALFAAGILYFIWRNKVVSNYVYLLHIIFSLVVCVFFFRAANSGGRIRHPEIDSEVQLSAPYDVKNTGGHDDND
jgi:uncharacterized membrane protein